jgi:hypothetical protein
LKPSVNNVVQSAAIGSLLVKHDIIAKYYALSRMPFPLQKYLKRWDWPNDYKTIVNAGRRKRSVSYKGMKWFPDVVIVDGKNRVREMAEIELEEDITPKSVEKWKSLSAATGMGPRGHKKLFICVPKSQAQKVRRMLEENKIDYAGLRSFTVSEMGEIKLKVVTNLDP